LSEPRNADVIASALTEVLGGEWRVRCLPAGSGGPSMTAQASSRPAPKPPSRPAQAEPEVPLPPEPPEEDEDLYAEEPKSLGTPQPEKPDPGAAAMKLLSDQLGARPLE
jgi:DNA polymerase-3 subunit gamma/tau